MSRNLGWICGVFLFFCISIPAQLVTQEISLDKGWNAVYLRVQPDDAVCDRVCADWPVSHINLYNMERAFVQYNESPTESIDRADDYFTWNPEHSNGGNSLSSLLAGHAYLIYATKDYATVLTGRPTVPRIQWLPGGTNDQVNLLGFCVDDGATFGPYLQGAGFGDVAIYTVGGTNELSPTYSAVGQFSGSINTVSMEPGTAYFMTCDKVSRYCGPLRVSPSGSTGLFFAEDESYATASFNNESGGPLTVTLELIHSKPSASGIIPILPPLYYFDSNDGWIEYNVPQQVVRTLESNESWAFRLAVDRTTLDETQCYGGIIRCTDSCGGKVEIPLEVEYGDPDQSQAVWPAGLWVGKAVLNQVSLIETNGTMLNGQPAGGTMQYRLLVHVDTQLRCRLLQRAIIAGNELSDGALNAKLYVDERDIPSDEEAIVRISSTAFGLNNDAEWDETAGGFGERLGFSYVIAHDDPVNPFIHARHPDHDGLHTDFKTPLPSGDDPQNYIPAIKPESFSISNAVFMVFDENQLQAGSPLWNPEEQLKGSYTHTVYGLRKEGAIESAGTFELRRVSRIGDVTQHED